MVDDARILELLEEIMESGRAPEDACAGDPELLPEVRERLRRLKRIEAQVDAMFPSSDPRPSGRRQVALRHEPRIPEIPRYEVQSILGYGGMGVVYKARHLKLKRSVAVKMLLAGAYAGPQERERLMREAQTIANLCHPNIVAVFDVGEVDGRLYFTMEYVDGGTLERKLGGTPQPAREAASLCVTLADAVHAAHGAGVVHRDLKPANILLTASGVPKVTDFGLARRFAGETDLTQLGAKVGTSSYMAPEQARGMPHVGPAADIYSLGALLYEMLTGRPPFRADSSAETQRQVIAEEPALPSKLNARVPRDLETACLKCLNKDPRRRYESAKAFGDDLVRFLDGEPIRARRIGPAARLHRWMRRKPAMTAFLVAATLLLMLTTLSVARERNLALRRRAELSKWADRLAHVNQLEAEGRFAEARAILQQAPDVQSQELQVRVAQAQADLDLIEKLDEIRLNRGKFKQGGGFDYARSADQYQAIFRQADLGELSEDPAKVAARLSRAPIRRAIVAALDDWAVCAEPPARAWILSVARQADPDPWRDRARDESEWANLDALADLAETADVIRQPVTLLVALGTRWRRLGGDPTQFLQRVQRQYPNDFWVSFELGLLIGSRDLAEGAGYFRAALALRPQASTVHFNLGDALAWAGKYEEAIPSYKRAIELEPTHTWAHRNLGLALLKLGRAKDAAEQFQSALSLDPFERASKNGLRMAWLHEGRGEEARAHWAIELQMPWSTYDDCDGYAEFCLFLGKQDEYQRACSRMLARFGSGTDPQACERLGRACLLLPESDQRVRTAAALIDRALAADPSRSASWARPYFLFAKALAEYRQGRFERAVALLGDEASRVLPPAPTLVLAMSLQRLGRAEEASQALAQAVAAFDWRIDIADNREAWMYHLLRREAETIVSSGH